MKDRFFILIVCIAFLIRLFSFVFTAIVNPDGVIYIHQARAIYYGLWDSILGCGIGFLSNYPIFIVGAYAVVRDWVIAAKLVSLLFGTFYLLLREFFRNQIALLACLAFALIPVFVDKSVDLVRDPVYWFFLVFGLYFFVAQVGTRNRLYLILSNIFLLMAAWARIEAALFIPVAFLYLLFSGEERKAEKLAVFAAPIAAAAVLGIASVMIFNAGGDDLLRIHEIKARVSAPLIQFQNLRAQLSELMNQTPGSTVPGFLHKARNLAWLVALGTIVKYAVSAYFYPFFLLFLIGLAGIWAKVRRDRRIRYLAVLSASALILLYLYVLQSWMMFNRLLALFILPSFILVGFGLERTIGFLQARFKVREYIAVTVVCILMLACALPKSLNPRETDKLVFKQIGQLIAEKEGNDKEIKVATALPLIRWI
ncbi:MAG: glycosyltransferase family 39 protein, partial [Deltaproteobacteria bacterium]|nr:glycosyltransferase family 39 protein [Deltaproteobacteria bacterium]